VLMMPLSSSRVLVVASKSAAGCRSSVMWYESRCLLPASASTLSASCSGGNSDLQ
jgi:hypothetical protein